MIKTKPVIQRTLEENKYYWSVVVDMIATHGFNGDAALAHHWCKFTFGIESTSTLDTASFESLMDAIRDHAKKYWELEIPLPTQF